MHERARGVNCAGLACGRNFRRSRINAIKIPRAPRRRPSSIRLFRPTPAPPASYYVEVAYFCELLFGVTRISSSRRIEKDTLFILRAGWKKFAGAAWCIVKFDGFIIRSNARTEHCMSGGCFDKNGIWFLCLASVVEQKKNLNNIKYTFFMKLNEKHFIVF